VAYFLTGVLVFSAENGKGTIAQHVTCTPDRSSRHSELRIPSALEDVVMWCLEKRPDERLGAAIELKAAFESCPFPPGLEQHEGPRVVATARPSDSELKKGCPILVSVFHPPQTRCDGHGNFPPI